MTIEETEQWVRENAYGLIDRVCEMDSCTNEYEQCIYQVGSDLYAVDFCNGRPSFRWEGEGDEHIYGPYKVEAFPRTVYEYYPVEE